MAKIAIFLKEPDFDALRTLAESEYRDPRAQAALIIREELTRRGLLTQQDAPVIPPANEQQVTA